MGQPTRACELSLTAPLPAHPIGYFQIKLVEDDGTVANRERLLRLTKAWPERDAGLSQPFKQIWARKGQGNERYLRVEMTYHDINETCKKRRRARREEKEGAETVSFVLCFQTISCSSPPS